MALFDGLPVPQMTDPNQRAIQARSIMIQGLTSGMALGQRRRFHQDEMKMREEQVAAMTAAKERQVGKGMAMMESLSKNEVKDEVAFLDWTLANPLYPTDPDTAPVYQGVAKMYSNFGKIKLATEKAKAATMQAKTAANIDKTFWEGVSKIPAAWQSEIIDMGFTEEGRPSSNQFKALGIIQDRLVQEKSVDLTPQAFSVTTPGGKTEEGVYNKKTGHFAISKSPVPIEDQLAKKRLLELNAKDLKFADDIAKAQRTFASAQAVDDSPKMKSAEAELNMLNKQRGDLQAQIGQLQNPETAPKARVRVKGPGGEKGTIEEGDSLPSGWELE